MQGPGTAYTRSDIGFSALQTRFDVSFSLDSLTHVELTGEMNYDDCAFAGISFAGELSDTNGVLFSIPTEASFCDEQFGFGTSARQTLAYTSTLGPGDYRLLFSGDPPGGNGSRRCDFNFTLTPVPEPGSAALLATDLALLAGRGRRH